jgi:preprotein translocase subunit Sec61beta
LKINKGPRKSGPSSSIGILNFFDADMSGPKMSPEFVLLITLVFIIIIIAIHVIG